MSSVLIVTAVYGFLLLILLCCNDEHSSAEMKNTEGSSDKDSSELEQYWKAVRDNPSDFTGWTYLLQYVEQEV